MALGAACEWLPSTRSEQTTEVYALIQDRS
jgi:hypothetical protein